MVENDIKFMNDDPASLLSEDEATVADTQNFDTSQENAVENEDADFPSFLTTKEDDYNIDSFLDDIPEEETGENADIDNHNIAVNIDDEITFNLEDDSDAPIVFDDEPETSILQEAEAENNADLSADVSDENIDNLLDSGDMDFNLEEDNDSGLDDIKVPEPEAENTAFEPENEIKENAVPAAEEFSEIPVIDNIEVEDDSSEAALLAESSEDFASDPVVESVAEEETANNFSKGNMPEDSETVVESVDENELTPETYSDDSISAFLDETPDDEAELIDLSEEDNQNIAFAPEETAEQAEEELEELNAVYEQEKEEETEIVSTEIPAAPSQTAVDTRSDNDEKQLNQALKWYSGRLDDRYFEFSLDSQEYEFEGTADINSIHVNIGSSSYGWNVNFNNGVMMNLRDLREYQLRYGKMPDNAGVLGFGDLTLNFRNVERIVVYESPEYFSYGVPSQME